MNFISNYKWLTSEKTYSTLSALVRISYFLSSFNKQITHSTHNSGKDVQVEVFPGSSVSLNEKLFYYFLSFFVNTPF